MRSEGTFWLRIVVLLVGAAPVYASALGVGDLITVAANTNVRVAPSTGSNEIEDSDYPGTAPAGTKGRITDGPQTANGYTWWKVDFGPGLYSGWAVQNGLEATASAARVALTLYVYEGSVTGPLILGARVTGQDGGGNNFDQTTNASGYVTLFGAPGTWRFRAAKDSYQPNSWSQDISSTSTRYAFLERLPTSRLPGQPTTAAPTVMNSQGAEPPVPISPGFSWEPGQTVDTITPLTFQWAGVSEADYYALAVSEYPYSGADIRHNPQRIQGTSYRLPADVLKPGKKYRWNVQAHAPAGWSAVSGTLYLQTSGSAPITVQQESTGVVVDAAMQYIQPHEGYREKAYQDTEGNWTVGVGFNLQDPRAYDQLQRVGASSAADLVKEGRFNRVTLDETTALRLFRLMVADCIEECRETWRSVYRAQPTYADFDKLPLDARVVAVDMIYQLGSFTFEREGWYAFFPPFDESVNPKTYGGAADRLESHERLANWRDVSGVSRVQDHVRKLRALDHLAGQTGDVRILDIPFITQSPPGTWADTENCGQASMLMVLSYHNGTIPNAVKIKDIDDWLSSKYGDPVNGYNGAFTDRHKLVTLAREYGGLGQSYTANGCGLDDIVASIDRGRPIIAAIAGIGIPIEYKKGTDWVTNSVDYKQGHWVVVIGYSGEHIICNDSGRQFGKNARYRRQVFLSAMYDSWSSEDWKGAVVVVKPSPLSESASDMSNTEASVLGRWVDDRDPRLAEIVTLQFEQDGTVLMSGPLGSVRFDDSGHSSGQWQVEDDNKMSFRFTGYPTLTASAQIEEDKLKDFKMGGFQPGLPLMKSTNP